MMYIALLAHSLRLVACPCPDELYITTRRTQLTPAQLYNY